MSHTYTSLLAHIVFSTKDRLPDLKPAYEFETHRYITGILRNLNGKMLAIDGTDDHLHMLIDLPPTLRVSDAVGKMKSNSSGWIHQKWPDMSRFGWQTGYGAFSVSKSNTAAVVRYIQTQKEHHPRVTFQEELLALLERNEISYDERYIWK